MVRQDDLKTYFENARRWEQDLLLSAHRSRRVAWVIAASACALSVVSGGAVCNLAPLQYREPFGVRGGKSTAHVADSYPPLFTHAPHSEWGSTYFLPGFFLR